MLCGSNKAILACAGSGKTSQIVEEALNIDGRKTLITTYTTENIDVLKSYLVARKGCVPSNIDVTSWFSFLLKDGVRPYQNYLLENERVRSIDFLTKLSLYHKKNKYTNSNSDIYQKKVSEFVCECNQASGGLVVNRLKEIYSHIFVDELQDFAGYDLSFLEELFKSGIGVTVVGDPRQGTFSTNNAPKNRQYRKMKIHGWLEGLKKVGLLRIEEKNISKRCNQPICDFADSLFPEFPKTKSKNDQVTKHSGIFHIKPEELSEYWANIKPVALRWNKNSNTFGYPARNIGISKGRTFDRVLIFPTKPMLEFLKTGDFSKAGDRQMFYVAVTRARHSVAFVRIDL